MAGGGEAPGSEGTPDTFLNPIGAIDTTRRDPSHDTPTVLGSADITLLTQLIRSHSCDTRVSDRTLYFPFEQVSMRRAAI